jgi:hypothetical protein
MVVPLGRKRAYTGCTQTTEGPTEPEILWRVSHPGPMLLNSSVQMVTGVHNMVNLLTIFLVGKNYQVQC